MSVSQFVTLFSQIKHTKKIEMTTFYHIIDENLQICTDFSEISLSKDQKKVIFARNR